MKSVAGRAFLPPAASEHAVGIDGTRSPPLSRGICYGAGKLRWMIDAWNPRTYSTEITSVLSDYSEIILKYHTEDRRLMDEHLNSFPYQSLKSNGFFSAYREFQEQTLAPILASSRIRVWHYARLMEEEVNTMCQRLVPSSLDYLRCRLDNLVAKTLLTHEDAEIIFDASLLHKQLENRTGRLWTTIIPLPPSDSGVIPLLESWGGESAYFWLSNERIVTKLKNLGAPRIVELETALSDNPNGYSVTETVLKSWAKQLGAPVSLSVRGLAITHCIATAKVIRIHTKGEDSFEAVATTYPEGVSELLKERNFDDAG